MFQKVLSNTSFRSLWFGQISSQLAINTMLFVLALRVYHLTQSNTAVSGLFLVYGVPAVFIGIIAGTIVDKLDSRRVLIACDIARALLVGLLFFIPSNIIFIYILTFFNSVITQFYVPAEGPTIPRLVKTGELVSANSLFSFTYFSSVAVGSIFAGSILKVLGPSSVFILISGLFFLAAVFVSGIHWKRDPEKTIRRFFTYSISYLWQRTWVNVSQGLRYIGHSGVLKDSLLLLTGTQIIFAILGTLGPGFADRVLQIDIRDSSLVVVGPVVLGIIFGAIGIGSIGQKFSPKKLIELGVIGCGVMLLLISITVGLSDVSVVSWFFQRSVIFPIVLTLFFLLGVANSMLDVPANSILQKEAEGEMRGRVYGMLTAAVGGVGMLPVVLGGILADNIGVGRVIFLLGLIISVYGVWRVKRYK